jgi:hypothetical protein
MHVRQDCRKWSLSILCARFRSRTCDNRMSHCPGSIDRELVPWKALSLFCESESVAIFYRTAICNKNFLNTFRMKFHLIHLARRRQERTTCESESVTIFYRTAMCNKIFLSIFGMKLHLIHLKQIHSECWVTCVVPSSLLLIPHFHRSQS